MRRRVDLPTLVAGLFVTALGIVLLLDRSGDLDLTIEALGPIACAGVGAVLLASGLDRRR